MKIGRDFTMNYCCVWLLQHFLLFLLSIHAAAANEMSLQLPFPFESVTDGPSKALLKIMFDYSRKRFAPPTEETSGIFAVSNEFENDAFLAHCKFIKEKFGGLKGLEKAIADQQNENIRSKLSKFLQNAKAKVTSDGETTYDNQPATPSRFSILLEIKATKLGTLMRECATDFSILRMVYEMANFILKNAFLVDFEKRAKRLADFWAQFDKSPKPPQIGINVFQKMDSEIRVFYGNKMHNLNTKTADELLKLLMANSDKIHPKQKQSPSQKSAVDRKPIENCAEIIDELRSVKWLENAILDEATGLNMREIYVKILEVFDNRRHSSSTTAEGSISCSTEFFRLHSLNYLSQFVLEQTIQSALISKSNLLYKKYRSELKGLREEFDTFVRTKLGKVVDKIEITEKAGETSNEEGAHNSGGNAADGMSSADMEEKEEESDVAEQKHVQEKEEESDAVEQKHVHLHHSSKPTKAVTIGGGTAAEHGLRQHQQLHHDKQQQPLAGGGARTAAVEHAYPKHVQAVVEHGEEPGRKEADAKSGKCLPEQHQDGQEQQQAVGVEGGRTINKGNGDNKEWQQENDTDEDDYHDTEDVDPRYPGSDPDEDDEHENEQYHERSANL